MDWSNIITATVVLGGIACILGLLLAYAAKLFAIDVDERITLVEEQLPHLNCGSCGFSGCEGYSRAIVEKGAPTNLCNVGGEKTAQKIAAIMGVAAEKTVRKVAFVRCSGGDNAVKKFNYAGIHDCAAANKVAHGNNKCEYSCLGMGTCVSVCPKDAISIIDGVSKIDREKCVGCGKCVEICPRNVITMLPYDSMTINVPCASHDAGKDCVKACSVGCIACGMCEKNCEHGAIKVIDNLATIDYEKCVACGKCAEVCPRKIIKNLGASVEVKKD